MQLAKSETIVSAFVLNKASTLRTQSRMGKSAVYVGTNQPPLSTNVIKCSIDFFDTGFFALANCQGNQVTLRRSAVNTPDGNLNYNIKEMRLY